MLLPVIHHVQLSPIHKQNQPSRRPLFLEALATALEAAWAANEPTTDDPQHEEDDGKPGDGNPNASA